MAVSICNRNVLINVISAILGIKSHKNKKQTENEHCVNKDSLLAEKMNSSRPCVVHKKIIKITERIEKNVIIRQIGCIQPRAPEPRITEKNPHAGLCLKNYSNKVHHSPGRSCQ